MNEILSVASHLLEPAANRYRAKAALFYPTLRDKFGDYLGEPEADEQATICEDCYPLAMVFFRTQLRLGKYKEQGAKGVQLQREYSAEKENLCLCGFCGHHIDVSLLFRDSQEVDHWMENVNDEQFAKACTDPGNAWQLNQILTSYDAFEHILEDIMPLANRVIQVLSHSINQTPFF